jgi:hypothetical protein
VVDERRHGGGHLRRIGCERGYEPKKSLREAETLANALEAQDEDLASAEADADAREEDDRPQRRRHTASRTASNELLASTTQAPRRTLDHRPPRRRLTLRARVGVSYE